MSSTLANHKIKGSVPEIQHPHEESFPPPPTQIYAFEAQVLIWNY